MTESEIFNLKKSLKNANYFWIALSLFISVFGYWSRAYRWKFTLNHLGYQTKFHNDFFAVAISYFMNLTVPRSGEVVRAVIINKYDKVPVDKAFGTIVAERMIDLIIFLMFLGLAFILQFKVISGFIFKHISPEKIYTLLAIGIICFITFLWIWFKSKHAIVQKLKNKLSGLVEGMTAILKMKDKWKYIFHSFFIWFSYLFMFYVCVFAIPETSTISFGVVIMGFIFGSVAVGFTNGGIGAFPIAIQSVMMLYGISKSSGAALGWIVWTSQTLLTVILGLSSYLLLNYLNKK